MGFSSNRKRGSAGGMGQVILKGEAPCTASGMTGDVKVLNPGFLGSFLVDGIVGVSVPWVLGKHGKTQDLGEVAARGANAEQIHELGFGAHSHVDEDYEGCTAINCLVSAWSELLLHVAFDEARAPISNDFFGFEGEVVGS